MAKKVTGYIKLQIPAGKATPAPPVGPALGQHGVNIVEFTKQFNARTADKGDVIIPVVITVYADRSFSFITKTPPAAVLLKKACNLQSGSGVPNKNKVAKISKAEVQKIAEGIIALAVKEKDNEKSVEISGTALFNSTKYREKISKEQTLFLNILYNFFFFHILSPLLFNYLLLLFVL